MISSLGDLPDLEIDIFGYHRHYRASFLKRVQKRLARAMTGQIYVWEKEPRRCRHISSELDKFVLARKLDAVLMFGSEGCAYSTSNVPIYCYADSIFGSRSDFYSDQRNMSAISIKHGRLVQQLALNRVSRIFISSQWAVDKATENYQYRYDASKFKVVGIGANLPDSVYEASPSDVPFTKKRVSFIWVGVDWERKRGEFAVAVVRALREKGLDARLHVIGPIDYTGGETWVVPHGSLDYMVPKDMELITQLYRDSSGLILPSAADLTPIVIAEAYAFGRPVFASNVGGVPEMVANEMCGFALTDDTPAKWANMITEFFDMYQEQFRTAIAVSCREAFLERYNWRSIACTIADTIRGDVHHADDNPG